MSGDFVDVILLKPINLGGFKRRDSWIPSVGTLTLKLGGHWLLYGDRIETELS